MRSHMCGDLGLDDVGTTVELCGWVDRRREHGEHLVFIDLRDRSGLIQCVVANKFDLRSEYVVRLVGKVRIRPEGTQNEELATGGIEIEVGSVAILSKASPPPFPLDERGEVDETLRLRHRYVDLRKPRMQRNLQLRSEVCAKIRQSMKSQGFVEVETPMLIASTPEGARDFVVPSRKEPGSFYALPQSPQLFKQLCMVGGVDRYYQIARCLRDEDLRADRQFEFMQLDAEASFVSQQDVIEFISNSVVAATVQADNGRSFEFNKISWLDAMERFGTDKPDTRFGVELAELTPIFENTQAKVFQAPCVKGICLEGGAASLSRKEIDDLVEACKGWGAKGLAWMKVVEVNGVATLEGGVAKFLTLDESSRVLSTLGAKAGDMVFLVADERQVVRQVLGLLRLKLGRPDVDEGGLNFLWVVDFPLFDGFAADGTPHPAHHPFTMPHEDDLELLEEGGEGLTEVRSQAYDLVLNGWELGSGSVRIHQRHIQDKVFSCLGIAPDQAQKKFGFLLDAFAYGAPPHAGFAYGIDRLVALLAGEVNIREVIAFPKTQSGADPLTGAPSPIEGQLLAELGLRVARM